MARKRRGGQLNLNFDGLTDAVTNLVGALILLVLLIIGISREALSQQTREPEPPQPEQVEGGTRPIVPLQRRIAVMRGQIQEVDSEIRALDGRLEGLRSEVDELLDQVREITPPAAMDEAEPDDDEEVREVSFRPPLERTVNKTPIWFIIENGRISYLDILEYGEQLDGIINREIATIGTRQRHVAPVNFDMSGTDFQATGELVFVSVPLGYEISIDVEVVRKPGATGEELSAANLRSTRFMQEVGQADSDVETIQFGVYPDSFDVYRLARTAVWDVNDEFDINWTPLEPEFVLRLGGGSLGAQ